MSNGVSLDPDSSTTKKYGKLETAYKDPDIDDPALK